nr:hypothetical protein [Micromonospora sp. DSM 115978]
MLVFVAIPAGLVVLISALALAGGGGRRDRRYRPGRPFEFTPVWFLSSPDQLGESARAALTGPGRAVGAGSPARALPAGEIETTGTRPRAGATGGASDRW